VEGQKFGLGAQRHVDCEREIGQHGMDSRSDFQSALLGAWLFGFGTIAFLYFAVYRNLPRNTAVAADILTRLTSENPMWWAALAACLVLGCALVGSWPRKSSLGLWIVLGVTFLIPVGFLGMFMIIASKAREAAK